MGRAGRGAGGGDADMEYAAALRSRGAEAEDGRAAATGARRSSRKASRERGAARTGGGKTKFEEDPLAAVGRDCDLCALPARAGRALLSFVHTSLHEEPKVTNI